MDYAEDTFLRVSNVLNKRAIEASADYAQVYMPNAVIMFDESKQRMFDYIHRHISEEGWLLEFGVANGYSINSLAARMPDRPIFGFDSFKGMTHDMTGWEVMKGDFNLNGVPPLVASNVELFKGYFDKTIKQWMDTHTGPIAFLNVDCDLYESTKTVLETLGTERIVPGTLILFDEFFGFNGWQNHEYKAWIEFVEKNKIKYEYVAINHMQVLVRIKQNIKISKQHWWKRNV